MNNTVMYLEKRFVPAIFMAIACIFCFAAKGFSGTYITSPVLIDSIFYIDPLGNDTTGDGSFANPWKTLSHATQTVTTSGDTIHVNPGTYLETVQCFLSEGVNLEGEGDTSVLQSTVNEFWKALLSLKSPEGSNGNQFVSNLKFDGRNLTTQWAIWVAGRSNVIIRNCTFIDFSDRGVIFSARNDFVDAPPDSVYSTGNQFYNNIINNCAAYIDTTNGNYGRGCLNIGGQMGMLIYSNTITQDQRPEGYNGWPIKYVNHGYLKNCRIYNNILTKIPYAGDFPGQNGWDFCIELFNIEGLEISGNTIQGSIDLNFNRKGSSAYSAWIHHNIMSRDTLNIKYESGIIFEFSTETAIVEHNMLNNVSCGVQFNTRDSSIISNCVIQKNLFANIASGVGIGASGGIVIISEGTNNAIINNLRIYNNTIVAAAVREPWWGIDFGPLDHGYATNVTVANNIVMGFPGAWLAGGDTATNMSQVALLANNTINNGNANLPFWPAGLPDFYTEYQNIHFDPLFDSVANNYHLQLISPLIDVGVNVGLPYNGYSPDIGYAETGSGGPLPVKLTIFTGKETQGKNLLQWTTVTENNSSHFNIERSNDGQFFETVGRVNASGFSTTELLYYFTDAAPLKGVNYYRLAMVNTDGKKEYSRIISITAPVEQTLQINHIRLSSGSNAATLIVNSAKTQTALLSVTDAGGRTVFNSMVTLQKGNNSITKGIPALSAGIYHVKLFTTDEVVVKTVFCRD
ncbi:MAG TPA: right-handed parallel beta-helix repeat-containing protein [Ferruginibacter sp.]|nr:right-handed parallel beta-helix repeat-containing protein [Ferruginibacter sp.]